MNDIDVLVNIRVAIEEGDIEKVIALIGQDKNRRDMKTVFGSWLHVASANGQLPIVQWLLDAGLGINNRSGIAKGTALNEAIVAGQLPIVQYLLKRGAEMDVLEPESNILFSAVQEGNFEIVKLLLEAGVDASVKYSGPHMTNIGAYEFAIEQGQREIAAYIKDWLLEHKS